MADYTPADGVNVMNWGIKLVAQPREFLCWYASALMMVNWKLGRGGNPPDPMPTTTSPRRWRRTPSWAGARR